MGFDDACNTGLVLGLGFSSSTSSSPSETPPSKPNQTAKRVLPANFEPSLTLGLSGHETFHHHHQNHPLQQQQQQQHQVCSKKSSINNDHDDSGTVSSFSSGGRIKRERDLSSDQEVEVETTTTTATRVSSRVISDEDDDGVNARKKLRLTKEQSALLEESFKQHSTLNPKQKQALARQLNLRPRQVEVWFQNRRARTKLKQTEVDCEFLKKCCETLTDENRRLQKELQELKALKLAQPFYMHMPAATLTMCPSCERIGGGAGGGGGGGVGSDGTSKGGVPFSSMASKPHCYNPFTNPSAAC